MEGRGNGARRTSFFMGDIAHVHSACAKGKCSTQEPQLSQCHILAAADDVSC